MCIFTLDFPTMKNESLSNNAQFELTMILLILLFGQYFSSADARLLFTMYPEYDRPLINKIIKKSGNSK